MSIYVLSDLHGCYKHFLAMIKKINFKKDTDSLYILGDIFDRGENPLKIIDYVLCHKNIFWIKGNHEEFFEDYIINKSYQLWDYNGGIYTRRKLLFKSNKYISNLYNTVSKLPIIKIIDKFILVHAGLYYPKGYEKMSLNELINIQNKDYNLWSRDNIGKEIKYKDYTVICGHTPVFTIKKNQNTILKSNGTIYIDCGAIYNKYGGQLACLRLNDMKEFYVNYNEI